MRRRRRRWPSMFTRSGSFAHAVSLQAVLFFREGEGSGVGEDVCDYDAGSCIAYEL